MIVFGQALRISFSYVLILILETINDDPSSFALVLFRYVVFRTKQEDSLIAI